jgi:hypothetical protein
MNNIEEILWNYIDGNCTADEQKAISNLIAGDEAYRIKYNELLSLNKAFAEMEFDEPPMAFTYNVMETIRTEYAQKPLKAAINKRIIRGISIFFVLTIVCLLVFTLANISLSLGGAPVNLSAGIKIPDIGKYITKPVIEGFLFFDLVLALYLFDTYLRRKNLSKQV